MDPLPTINKAYVMTSQQETLPTTPILDSTAFAVAPGSTAGCGQQPQGRGSGRNGPRQQMLCTHCKKTNHTVDNCYFKYGFPPGYRTKEQTTTMNISHDSVVTAHKPPPSPAGCNSDSPMQISKEDYNQLMALLHSSKKESNTHSHSSLAISNSEQPHHVVSSMSQSGNTLNSECFWILDSGASDHVCPHIKFFTSLHMIKPISVKFPDGSTALYSGSIHFSEHLHLHDVLYIPQFHFNLISVYQLTRSLNCRVIFSHVFCGIQDPHTQ